jgi:hypothetical protein
MNRMNLEQVVRNIDRRLDRAEQILPTLPPREELDEKVARLATKEELRAAIAPLATKEELRAAIAPLATKEELRAAIAPLATKEELRAAIAPLATKRELQVLGQRLDARITEESERSRRETRVIFESLKDDIRIVAEGVASVQTTIDQTIRPMLMKHERRITTLEDRRGPADVRRRR